ncbi:hypothetical protein SAMN04488544_1836 [Microlunatus sagamiharensis]|uniref:FG-GAP repeat-containing protein n=1 Tax=Microlunatus sagamiharensis TaxID=546874 RepID=A0A1H2MCX7_9ACTN|nr:hypothetical protein [Microlunatus sagamiharensis]SDU91073.1 hypothetical protein SAMN04488544_1836 [Microlunatus sagamiharensis]
MSATGVGRRRVVLLLASGLALGVTSALVAPASPASAGPGCGADGALGTAGVVRAAGMPSVGPGTVELRPGGGIPALRLTGTSGTGFGSALSTAYVDADACLDLVVGAPLADGRGSVQVFLGGPDGFTAPPAVTLTGRSVGERFGTQVAVRERAAGGVDVWVGAPRRTVDGRTRAGAVDHLVVAADRTSRRVETITAAGAAGGVVQASAEFGSVLTASVEGLVVGVPRQDVGGRTDAGAAYWFPLPTGAERVGRGTAWTQASPGVAGSPEKGDHFGSAVSVSWGGRPRWVLVGVPDEDIGTRKDAGLVQSFTLDARRGALAPGSSVDETQARAGVRATAGHRFGAAVAVADGSCLSGGWAVGAPGTDVGSRKDAGAFSLVAPTGSSCTSTRFTQGSLSQHDESGDRFGATLSSLGRTRPDEQTPVSQLLLVGAPGEDSSGGVRDVGSVTSFWRLEQPDDPGPAVLLPSFQYFSASDGDRARTAYGTVLPDAHPRAVR